MTKSRPNLETFKQSSPTGENGKHLINNSNLDREDLSPGQSLKTYQDILESLEDIIFAVDPDGRVQYISPNIKKFLGYRQEEIIGKIPVEFMQPEEGRAKYEFFSALAARKERIKSLELTGIHKQGRLVFMEVNAAPFFSPDGTFLGYRGVSRDVTERRRIEEQLQASRNKLQASIGELEMMNRIAKILLTTPDDKMYGEVLQAVLEFTESPHGVFGYIDEDGDVVAPSLTRNIWNKCRMKDKSIRFPRDTWSDTVWVRAILQKKTVISNQPGRVPDGHIPVKRVIVTPILFQDKCIGYLKAANRPSDYDARDELLLERIAGFIAPALDARLQRDFEERRRRAAEEALKTSQQDLKHAQAVARLGSWRMDFRRNELFWPEETREIFKIPGDSAITYGDFLEMIYTGDRERFNRNWINAVPGEILEIDYRAVVDGEIKWLRCRTELEYNENGDLPAAFGTIQDITESKRAQEALREREERFRSVFNKGAVPMALTATDSRLITVNAAYCEMLGYSEEELAGLSFYSITHPDDIAENKIGIDAVVNGERDSFRMEKRYFRKDGRIIWVDMSTVSVRDTSGRVLYIVTHAPEITERKEAEQRLLDSEKRFSQSFYASPAPTTISTIKEGRYIDCNESWAKAMGYNREEIIGKNIGDLSIWVKPEKRALLIRKLRRSGFLKNQPIQLRTKSGEIRDILWSAELINISGEKFMLSLFHDLTERKKIERDLRESKEKLETKVQERTAQLTEINKSLLAEIQERKLSEKRLRLAQKNLRAMAAEIVLAEERSRQNFATDLHDTVVQTLGAAKLKTEFLREFVPEKGSKYLNELRNMLSQSISEARLIMAEMSPPVLYELGFNPAIEWLAEQISSQHDLDIVVVADDHGPSMHEVQVLLFQAARELLMNIVKHANAGKVLVSIKGDRKNLRIIVKDDGDGFDGNVSFRADTSSGFGLFSIRERLRHMGGRLIIKSKPGQGTRVSIVAPRTAVNNPPQQ